MVTTAQVLYVPPDATTAHAGMVTKLKVAHPHLSHEKVGIMAAKRLVCDDKTGVCHTYKQVNCFRAPENHTFTFASKREKDATKDEIKAFTKAVIAEAWNNAGKSNAKIKKEWKCTEQDMKDIKGWAAAF